LIVLGFLCSMAFVLYLDRICMAQAVAPIKEELALSNTEMGVVLMAFTLAYGLFEVPTGHWGDRYGSRRVLTRIVLWWSAFTALTGACLGFASLVCVRFLFGAGEAGAYPNAARVLTRWFPPVQRGRNQGLFMSSSLVGGAVAPMLAAELICAVGWRWTFVLFGAIGVLWSALFAWWFRDDPAEVLAAQAIAPPVVEQSCAEPEEPLPVSPATPDAETIRSGNPRVTGHHSPAPPSPGIPWGAVLTNRNIWLLGTIITLSAFNTYLYFSWYPQYLEAARQMSNVEAGRLASLVLAGGAAGTLGGGFVADLITRAATNLPRARRRYCQSVFLAAALLLLAGVHSDSPTLTSLFAGASCLAILSQQAIWWACAIEISGRHLGALFGLMNSMGVIGAMASQFLFGAFADWRAALGYAGRDQWDPAFTVYIAALVAAAVCWQFVDTSRGVDGLESRH
jgi:sugar phosphate permease